MIIEFGDKTFQDGWGEGLERVLRNSIMAHKMGHHALVIPPSAFELAIGFQLPQDLADDIEFVHRSWLTAQGLVGRATRIVAITSREAEHCQILGNRFLVFYEKMTDFGLYREPALIVESLNSDARFLKLIMRKFLEMTDAEFRRFWGVRFEQGAGGNTHECIDRYPGDPMGTFVLCDRDGSDPCDCGPTARKCIQTAIEIGAFAEFEQALSGGYSPALPNFGMRVLGAHETENLILPHVADLYFSEIAEHTSGEVRKNLVKGVFLNFPRLTNQEARLWLDSDFRAWPEFGKIFAPTTIREIVDWVSHSQQNEAKFESALRGDLKLEEFYICIDDALRDVWTLGIRNQTLS